jgi:hypothetical protein
LNLVRRFYLGFLGALVAAMGFSLLTSLLICLGLGPELRGFSDGAAPLLGLLVGGYLAAGTCDWKPGARIGVTFVVAWLGFWFYVMGRVYPVFWITEGLTHLGLAHLGWWIAAVLVGALGGFLGGVRPLLFSAFLGVLYFGGLILAVLLAAMLHGPFLAQAQGGPDVERIGPAADGTSGYFLTFDFQRQKRLNIGVYDCDSDDAKPFDDFNTTYMGQDLAALMRKLEFRAAPAHRQILCVINGGFFGASSLSVAHHEEPMVEEGRALYNVDLLQPKDQAWFFAVNSPNAVLAGRPRFTMFPDLAWGHFLDYQTVLGGVRPLRFEGQSVALKPGAGVTTLRCSRTSVGWSADGSKFYVLSVFDPDGEMASQWQRKSGGAQTGGWDVAEVQKVWEHKQVPFALLFDGGESTQLAVRRADGGFTCVPSGYQYSFTLGYLYQRPLRFTPPILPPSEAHRGVLNYLYVDGPQ